MAEGLIEQWGARYAEKQVLYDESRALQPIQRELALSRQLGDSKIIKQWAEHPDDAQLTKNALDELESFRANFTDHSYFIALASNHRYYFNNAQNQFAGHPFRYVLNPKNPNDQWFFDTLRQNKTIDIDVNTDATLGVTKVWINVLVRNNAGKAIAIVGTGLALGPFLDNVVNTPDPGVTNLFVDTAGAIQLYRDQGMIDYASITKQAGNHKDIRLLFSQPGDQNKLYAAMKTAFNGRTPVATQFVHMNNKRYLAGIVYIPDIHWYEITLIDLDSLLPIKRFTGILSVYVMTLLVALLVFYLVISHFILKPIEQLDREIINLQEKNFIHESKLHAGPDEIGRLTAHFKDMTRKILDSKLELEIKVRERTEALEHLSKTDMLTQLLNRRGMTEQISAEINRAHRENTQLGILWIDVDFFKKINDQHGHAIGDNALLSIGELIRTVLRPYDLASRWGGDEFLILVQDCSSGLLEQFAQRLQSRIANHPVNINHHIAINVSITIGGALLYPEDSMESVLQKADHALYIAKNNGRNCFVIHQ